MRCGGACVGAVVLALSVLALSGCSALEPQRNSSSPGPRPRPLAATLPPNYVLLDVALLERPAGNVFLNKDLWAFMDESIVSLDNKAVLDDNGFRVGQLVGMPPGGLQALFKSERSCINPRRRLLPTGAAAAQLRETPSILLGPLQSQGQFSIKEGRQTTELALENVQYQLEVEPALSRDGRVRLRFTPRVVYGEPMRTVAVLPDRTDFEVKVEKPHHRFPGLSWEVTLAANDYLIIGGCYDQPQSLGGQAFVQEEGPTPVQRLLVVRTARSLHDQEADTPTLEDLARRSASPPLALQATLTAIRASGKQ